MKADLDHLNVPTEIKWESQILPKSAGLLSVKAT